MQNALPAKSIDIPIKGSSYTLNFPTTGQYIDIQCLKNKITNDNYNALASSGDEFSSYASLLVDMIAVYNILIPELKKDINVPSILGLSMIESKVLLDSYVEHWLPFFNNWMKIISTPATKTETAKDAE